MTDKSNKKYLLRIGMLMLLELMLLVFGFCIDDLRVSADTRRYISQGLTVLATVIGLVCLRELYKYVLLDALKKAGKKVSEKIRKAVRFISRKISLLMTKMGFGGRKRLAVGKDEYSFTFDEEGRKQSRLSLSGVSKWKDLTDNNQKLRFLFIRYMMKRIRKGYRKRRGKTPLEWAGDLHAEGDHLELFESYNLARYGYATGSVSNEALERARAVCDKKTK